MSEETKNEFKILSQKNYDRCSGKLKINKPVFSGEGFLSQLSMKGPYGAVEILCGPPEYHAEVFIESYDESKRYNLTDLMGIDSIREWVKTNRPKTDGQSHLAAELEWIFDLLSEGLKDADSLKWIS